MISVLNEPELSIDKIGSDQEVLAIAQILMDSIVLHVKLAFFNISIFWPEIFKERLNFRVGSC